MRKKLLLSFCAIVLASLTLLAQNTTVTGKVTDAQTGAPLSGVTISLNAKGLGVTKADGTYSVAVPPSAKKLTLSYVGYDDQQITVGSASQNIKLVPGEKSLNEVVVTGYQALQKRQITGAIATVKGETFKNTPIGSLIKCYKVRPLVL